MTIATVDYLWTQIKRERARQERLREAGKFKATCATLGPNRLTSAECVAVLAEEFGEVAKAVNEGKGLREELIQTAAVCVAWLERIDN